MERHDFDVISFLFGLAFAALAGWVLFVDDVEIFGNEVGLSTANGAGVIADVAVALNGCGVPVQSLTLRTPTLDDVFLSVTGSHLSEDELRGPEANESTDEEVPA